MAKTEQKVDYTGQLNKLENRLTELVDEHVECQAGIVAKQKGLHPMAHFHSAASPPPQDPTPLEAKVLLSQVHDLKVKRKSILDQVGYLTDECRVIKDAVTVEVKGTQKDDIIDKCGKFKVDIKRKLTSLTRTWRNY